MRSFVEVSRELVEHVERYRAELERHLKTIKEVGREFFGEGVSIYVFGSTVRGDRGPLSDIDVAVVTEEKVGVDKRLAFKARLRERLGLFHPFEIHVVSRKEWEGWYLKFVRHYWRV